MKRNLSRKSTCKDPVERRFRELPDLPLPGNNHSQDTGHDTSHGHHTVLLSQKVCHGLAIAQRECPGEVDSHQIIFFGTQIGGI